MLCNTKYVIYFLGTFVKHLRIGTISFVMSVGPSLYKENCNSHLKDFLEISRLGLFTEICRNISSFYKSGQN
jgi:hypothetical protein